MIFSFAIYSITNVPCLCGCGLNLGRFFFTIIIPVFDSVVFFQHYLYILFCPRMYLLVVPAGGDVHPGYC